MLSKEQTALLEGKLNPERVRQRQGADGKPVLYVEAWDLVDQANRIFGFGCWSRETMSVEAIHPPVMRPNERDPSKTVMVASFWSRVRITVYSQDGSRSIMREGCGGSTAYQKTVGDAVEQAIKAAESDATKRAFATFGNQFGLALYDKSHKNVGHDDPPQVAHAGERPMARIDVGFGEARAESGRESGREPGAAPADRAPESAPRASNSQRALTVRGAQPNGNGGLRY